ncbi:MAG: DNA processing protein DprA, partial [Saccharothrix sp.]|nr:DNA processing protein DprA [Saccharothrix sp.]
MFLLRAAEPPALAVYEYVAAHGPVDAVATIRNGTAPSAVLGEITRPDARIDDDLRALDDGTARLLTPEDDEWPIDQLSSLGARHGVPLALWVRGSGSLTDLTRSAVTVTGARASTEYGDAVARDLSRDLVHAETTVVSGGGLGVDEAAHRAALAARGRTIVV